MNSAKNKRYLIVFEKADGNYSAYSPDIPGCIATGNTLEEAERNIKEAISFHIEGLRKDGQALPASASFSEYIEI
ncbi:MAG: type II toxin-antitoxin system HicB family antitoxin [Chloroflexota bacterium]